MRAVFICGGIVELCLMLSTILKNSSEIIFQKYLKNSVGIPSGPAALLFGIL